MEYRPEVYDCDNCSGRVFADVIDEDYAESLELENAYLINALKEIKDSEVGFIVDVKIMVELASDVLVKFNIN